MKLDLTPTELAKKSFTGALQQPEPVSVYEVCSDISEAFVASALLLNRETSISSPVFLLRIPAAMPVRFNISVSSTKGETDVEAVNTLHRDLIADPSDYVKVCEQLYEAVLAGGMVVRRVEGKALTQRFSDYLNAQGVTKSGLARASRYAQRT
ncbi:MAG: hypothetical protein KC492_16730 [Myxococcales bacterium]|nr:hypothetical protein [Myxococcales bacterium]